VLYETIGDFESAGKQYREAVKYDPDDGNVNNNYAVYLCGEGKYKEAEKHFNTAVQDPFYQTPGIAYANAGICAMQQDKMDKAEQYLRQSLEFDARNGAALLPMADLSFRNGSYLRARGFLQRFESVQARTEESLSLGYRIETALGDSNSAQNYLQALRESFPEAQILKSMSQEQQ
jgi:type IV pilus assembly protein PilF